MEASPDKPTTSASDIGLTSSIGSALFTYYLLPFEITSILLLMAIVGAMTLARRIKETSAGAAIVPGSQVLALNVIDPSVALDDTRAVVSRTTDEVRETLGVIDDHDPSKRD